MLACGGEAVPDLGLSGLVSGSVSNPRGDEGCGGDEGAADVLALPLTFELAEVGGGA